VVWANTFYIKNYCVSIKEGSIFIADNAITPAGMRKLFISEICRSDAPAFCSTAHFYCDCTCIDGYQGRTAHHTFSDHNLAIKFGMQKGTHRIKEWQ